MDNHTVILSGGSIPWLGVKQAIQFGQGIGFDGIEFVPFIHCINELKKNLKDPTFNDLTPIKSIHQSWRLDIGHDSEYGISPFQSALYSPFRALLFPRVDASNRIIDFLSQQLNIPVVVHGISNHWTQNSRRKEFKGGIEYEIIGTKIDPKKLKKWLLSKKHTIVLDTRDDQSLSWGVSHGFNNWKELWKWIGIKKISAVQLTLIGTQSMKKILNNRTSLAEEQLLWLHSQNWKGTITVEVNPISLFILTRGKFRFGLKHILSFVRQTLDKGKNWS